MENKILNTVDLTVKGEATGTVKIGSFKSLCESLTLRAEGEGSVLLYGIRADGISELYRRDELSGKLEYTFDPVSLAVYSGYVSFEVLFEGRGELISLSVAENLSEAVEKKEERVFEKNNPAPSKMLFMGNSLLLGMENSFGMCSSAPDKDYYHYVSTFISKINPKCEFYKLHGSGFEHSQTLVDFEKWWGTDPNVYTKMPAKESFTSDLDLIILQFGDNINTAEKFDTFKKDGDAFIERVRACSPGARILLVHGWYSREPVYSDIVSLCERWGLEQIDIRDLRTRENEAHGRESFVSVDGSQKPVKETWITHPGDRGMKLIADRIIERLAIREN